MDYLLVLMSIFYVNRRCFFCFLPVLLLPFLYKIEMNISAKGN